jgi:Tol biopolymer transport system component
MLWSSQSHDEEPLTGGIKMYINDWSQDGKWLLGVTGGQVWLIPFSSFRHAETAAQKIVSNPAYLIYQPHISPDDRWVVFQVVANSPNPESALYVVPASGGPWTRITDGRHWDDKPRWSPDGKSIYFVSRAAASSMSGESASIRPRERPLASRFRYPNSTASA